MDPAPSHIAGQAEAPDLQGLPVIFHPGAGGADRRLLEDLLHQRLARLGHRYVLTCLSPEDDPARIAREAVNRGASLVAAAGGDGTVSRVASGLVGTQARLGVLPLGTGNGLARALGLPMDLPSALDLLAGPHDVRSIDVLECGSRAFLLSASLGLSSRAFRSTPQEIKRRLGWPVYLWNGLVGLAGLQPYRFDIVVDGRRHRATGTDLVLVNTFGFVPGLPAEAMPRVHMDDGKIDLLVFRARHALAYVAIAVRVLLGRPVGHRQVRSLSAEREVVVDSTPPAPVQADGDIIGNPPMEFRVRRAALQVVVPVGSLGWRGKHTS